ncbi:MAG TPA: selenocysteine-specific translation elongation factor [Desulfobacteraceae bacterium]|nr:selenocysteine-specific translation elongation factor [Desulfobacteraceae bacterium]
MNDQIMGKAKHYITMGVAGHVDHGKTSLVKSLTGIDTDRLEEEKRRGLSIESSIAPFEMEDGIGIALVDVPGHTDYIKNTIRGLSAVDAAILVVAADEGCMPQTREHLDMLGLLGVRSGFVVLTKVDLVDEETLDLAEMEIIDEIEGSFLEGAPIVRFSALDRRGLEGVRSAVKCSAGQVTPKEVGKPFRLWIDQVRSNPGFGTVVTGTISAGSISLEDTVKIFPAGVQARVRSLEVHNRRTTRAVAGQRVGINLHRVSVGEASRGMVLADIQSPSPFRFINAALTLLTNARRPVTSRQMLRIHAGTAVANARIFMMEKESLKAGESGLVQLRMKTPFPAAPGEKLVVCPLGEHRISGGGRILEVTGEKFRASKAPRLLPYLEELNRENLQGALENLLPVQQRRLLSAREMADRTGFAADEIERKIKAMMRKGKVVRLRVERFIARESFDGFMQEALHAARSLSRDFPLKSHFNAVEINSRLPHPLEWELIEKILDDLAARRMLLKQNGGYIAPDAHGSLSDTQREIVMAILTSSANAGLAPLSVDRVWKLTERKFLKNDIRRMVNYLNQKNKIMILNDKRFLSPGAVEEIKSRVGAVIRSRGAFTIGDCKQSLGYGRTVAIPILEYLDTIGFTRREGDIRVFMERNP